MDENSVMTPSEETTEPKPAKKASAPKGGKGKGYITVTLPEGKREAGLNVRSEARKPAKGELDNVVTELSEGDRRQVQDATDGWVKVREGWIMAEFTR
jgi:hypothetical protein